MEAIGALLGDFIGYHWVFINQEGFFYFILCSSLGSGKGMGSWESTQGLFGWVPPFQLILLAELFWSEKEISGE